jgi:predicted permease
MTYSLVVRRWSLGVYLLKDSSDEVVEESRPSREANEDERTLILPTRTAPLYTSLPTSSDTAENHSCEREIIDILTSLPYAIHRVMNPPLYAALAALIVGTNPVLKQIFFDENSPVYLTFTRTTEHLGNVTVPLTLLVLGAQLRNIPRARGEEMVPMASCVMTCRFVVMPVIGVILVLVTYQHYLNDRMLWFVLMLLASGPSAVNCMNIAQLTGTFQEEMATLLFYSYIALAPLLTITLMVMLTVLQSMGDT